jgi:hypothetical protein
LHCHPQTVRIHVARFNQRGIEGLGVQPGSGRKPRLTEAERSVIVALRSLPPPGLCWLPGTSVRKTGRVLRTDMPG